MRPTKIIVFTIVAIFVVLLVMLGANFIIGSLMLLLLSLTGIDLVDVFGGWGGILLIIALIHFLPSNWLAWNRKYYIEGEALIDAPIAQVWDWLQIRERDDYFTSTTKKIRKVPGTNDEYHMLLDERLNDDVGDIPNHIHVRVLDEEPHEYMAYHIVNVEKMPLFGKDHLMTEVLLDEQKDRVRVRYIETLSRVTLTGFLALLFLNPARDAMRSLKSQIEGGEDHSVIRRMVDDMGEDGKPGAEVRRATHIGGITAMVLVTALTAGLLYFISTLVAP